MTWKQFKCWLGYHEWEWKRTIIKNHVNMECGWAEGNICKKCGKKQVV